MLPGQSLCWVIYRRYGAGICVGTGTLYCCDCTHCPPPCRTSSSDFFFVFFSLFCGEKNDGPARNSINGWLVYTNMAGPGQAGVADKANNPKCRESVIQANETGHGRPSRCAALLWTE
jgi:hypothetical protein